MREKNEGAAAWSAEKIGARTVSLSSQPFKFPQAFMLVFEQLLDQSGNRAHCSATKSHFFGGVNVVNASFLRICFFVLLRLKEKQCPRGAIGQRTRRGRHHPRPGIYMRSQGPTVSAPGTASVYNLRLRAHVQTRIAVLAPTRATAYLGQHRRA